MKRNVSQIENKLKQFTQYRFIDSTIRLGTVKIELKKVGSQLTSLLVIKDVGRVEGKKEEDER